MNEFDVVIVGGGPAGLAAALGAKEDGAKDILIIERDQELGGILNQCIHNGFGLHTFKEELTGPEYAYRFVEQVKQAGIQYKLNTMVMDITKNKIITGMNKDEGMFELKAKSIILAMGCRERARGALNIPGFRPAGIFSAGTAQRLVNMEGFMPGKRVVILGSGDIGLIMARRMTLEGAKVLAVAELMPFSGGLKRNIAQCLDDFDIPLLLEHTIIDIQGKDRVTGITLAKVDKNRRPIKGTEIYYDCDTLLLSVGLVPENELTRDMGVEMSGITNGPMVNESLETSIPGVFACGNVLHVHDLVDFVSQEARIAGKQAAAYAGEKKKRITGHEIPIIPADGVRYTVPSSLCVERMEETMILRLRVGDVYQNKSISVWMDDQIISKKKKQVLAPGEMEEVTLTKIQLGSYANAKQITVRLEDN